MANSMRPSFELPKVRTPAPPPQPTIPNARTEPNAKNLKPNRMCSLLSPPGTRLPLNTESFQFRHQDVLPQPQFPVVDEPYFNLIGVALVSSSVIEEHRSGAES